MSLPEDVREVTGLVRESFACWSDLRLGFAHATADGLGGAPRVHGNGFVQLDLPGRLRLHVWGDPRVPRQSVSTQIHNHVFGFASRVYVGRLVNVTYSRMPDPAGRYRLCEAVCRDGEDTMLVPVLAGSRRTMTPVRVQAVEEGETYDFPDELYHETLTNQVTVTVIEKRGRTLAERPEGPRPRVFVPHDREPDNSFHRDRCDPWLLWSVVFRALSQEV